jgi:hypothetical protein
MNFFFNYKCQHCGLYGVIGDSLDEVHAMLELPIATDNDYISIAYRCCKLSSDGCR